MDIAKARSRVQWLEGVLFAARYNFTAAEIESFQSCSDIDDSIRQLEHILENSHFNDLAKAQIKSNINDLYSKKSNSTHYQQGMIAYVEGEITLDEAEKDLAFALSEYSQLMLENVELNGQDLHRVRSSAEGISRLANDIDY